ATPVLVLEVSRGSSRHLQFSLSPLNPFDKVLKSWGDRGQVSLDGSQGLFYLVQASVERPPPLFVVKPVQRSPGNILLHLVRLQPHRRLFIVQVDKLRDELHRNPRSEERRVGKECRCRWSAEY